MTKAAIEGARRELYLPHSPGVSSADGEECGPAGRAGK
jgi:hypothetical protein